MMMVVVVICGCSDGNSDVGVVRLLGHVVMVTVGVVMMRWYVNNVNSGGGWQ